MPTQNLLMAIAPYAVLLIVFYLFLIRPQKKKEKAVLAMRDGLKVGDEIVTIGGIYGKIVTIKEDTVTIEVGLEKEKLKVAKWAIGRVETE